MAEDRCCDSFGIVQVMIDDGTPEGRRFWCAEHRDPYGRLVEATRPTRKARDAIDHMRMLQAGSYWVPDRNLPVDPALVAA